jgi:phosphocarrier protein HPr
MTERTAIVVNTQGIHCRPSAAIVKEISAYPGRMEVESEAGRCDPRSILGLMALALGPGDRVTVRVSGPEEEAWGRRLAELLATHFDFPPREEGETNGAVLRGTAGRPPG